MNNVARRSECEHSAFGPVFLLTVMNTCDGQHIPPYPYTVTIRDETPDPVELSSGTSDVAVIYIISFGWKFDDWQDRLVDVLLTTEGQPRGASGTMLKRGEGLGHACLGFRIS